MASIIPIIASKAAAPIHILISDALPAPFLASACPRWTVGFSPERSHDIAIAYVLDQQS